MYASAFGVKDLLFVISKPWSKTVTARICPISSESTESIAFIPVVLPIEEMVGKSESKFPELIISTELIPPSILTESEL